MFHVAWFYLKLGTPIKLKKLVAELSTFYVYTYLGKAFISLA